MPPNCPWSDYTHATIHYCEDNLCTWVTQPANAWSAMAFVLVGLWLTLQARSAPSRYVRLIGPIAIFIGVTTFGYHASFSFVGQVFDLGSMYCLSALLIVMNLRRLGMLAESLVAPTFVALAGITTGLVVAFKVIGIPLFAVHLITAVALERKLYQAAREPIDYRPFLAALGIFAVAFGFWNLDYRRIWCDPSGHVIQGHAIWHVLDALIFAAIYRFYAQFKLEDRSAQPIAAA